MNHFIDTPHTRSPSSLSKHRLTNISHLFLSDESERLSRWRNTLIMPVLMVSKNDDHVVYELDQAVKRHNRTCLVLNIESQLGPEAMAATHAQDANIDDAKAPDVCLIPITASGTTRVLNSNRLLLAVPASLPGVRLAYNHLATLAAFGIDLKIEVAMLDAADQKAAQRFFKFLSSSARNLLSMEIQCGGYVDSKRGSDKTTSPVNISMDEIAKAILAKTPRHGLPPTLQHALSATRKPPAEMSLPAL